MASNVLVCGGLPRGATTFLYTELSNYSNVHRSLVKEAYLFSRSSDFISSKLRRLDKDRIYLDFTPEYIFDFASLERIKKAGVNCFFIIREYGAWRESLVNYLAINGMVNDSLTNVGEDEFRRSVSFVQDNFLTFSIEEVVGNVGLVVDKLQSSFGIDFGDRCRNKVERNASSARKYYFSSFMQNHLRAPLRLATATLWGVL